MVFSVANLFCDPRLARQKDKKQTLKLVFLTSNIFKKKTKRWKIMTNLLDHLEILTSTSRYWRQLWPHHQHSNIQYKQIFIF